MDKKRYKIFFSLVFILLILSFITLNFSLVSAQQGINVDTGGGDINFINGIRDNFGEGTKPVTDFFASWQSGDIDLGLAKLLFLILIALVIYSVIETIPFLGKERNVAIKVVITAIVAFFATAYLTPQEIYAIILSYTSLGFVLAALIPFVILVFFSITLAKEHGGGTKIFLKIVWTAFIFFLLYKLVVFWMQGNVTTTLFVGYLLMIILSILYIFFLQDTIIKNWFEEDVKMAKLRYQQLNKWRREKSKREREEFEDYTNRVGI
ncbi:hypothetical protein COU56_01205 [Candidatus Pacearchaeota archaeon CG10_big_fil_rev_8_21_14_0_10_31_9]|nr:MAG: hypothetical protein COU56_01205 [Candidatus Pacearchaeota archaeon CG10_big_fil_rev_8_21_14_0_10_31_9]